MNDPFDPTIPDNLPEDDALALPALIAYWEKELGYTCEAERTLIRNLAAARLRLDRCRSAHAAGQALDLQKAQRKALAARRHRARKTAQALSQDPAGTLQLLESTAEGRDWLAARWAELDRTLAHALRIRPDDAARAMHRMGYPGDRPGVGAPMTARVLWVHLLQAQSDGVNLVTAAPALLNSLMDKIPLPPGAPADYAEAREWLRDLCRRQREHLDRLGREADARFAADPEAQAQARSEADALAAQVRAATDDRAAQARRRVEREADLAYARNLSLLMRLRKGRRDEREWELKEARRRPFEDPETRRMRKAAHRPTSVVANPIETKEYAAFDPGAPQRTDSAPGRADGAPRPASPATLPPPGSAAAADQGPDAPNREAERPSPPLDSPPPLRPRQTTQRAIGGPAHPWASSTVASRTVENSLPEPYTAGTYIGACPRADDRRATDP